MSIVIKSRPDTFVRYECIRKPVYQVLGHWTVHEIQCKSPRHGRLVASFINNGIVRGTSFGLRSPQHHREGLVKPKPGQCSQEIRPRSTKEWKKNNIGT